MYSMKSVSNFYSVTAVAAVLLFTGMTAAGHAQGDVPAGIRVNPNSGVAFKVLYSFNSYVLDANGQPTAPVKKDMTLKDADVVVDVAGSMILEMIGKHGSMGHVQMMQNTASRFGADSIVLNSGEMIVAGAAETEVSGKFFGVPVTQVPVSGYLYYRDGDSILSLSFREKPVHVVTASGEQMTLMPGESVKASADRSARVHQVLPYDASVSMRDLLTAIADLHNPVAKGDTIRVIKSGDARIAMDGAAGLEHKLVMAGDEFVLQGKHAPLMFTLTDPKDPFSFEYRGTDKSEVREYVGPMTLLVYEDKIQNGSLT